MTATEVLEGYAGAEAEHALIGGLLQDNRLFDRISLRPEHFHSERNRSVFAEIVKQVSAGKPCDVLTVYASLATSVTLADLNGYTAYAPSSSNLLRYAEIVLERSKSRALLEVSSDISELAQSHDLSIEERVNQAQGLLTKLLDGAPKDDWTGIYEGMLAHSQILEKRHNGELEAWSTGLIDLDDYLEGGMRPGELVIVGARPSMGKTALGLSIGVHMARARSVGFMSMEMSKSEVNDRLTAMLGEVSMSSVKRPRKGEGLAWGRVLEGVDRAKSLRFFVSDQGGLNLNQLRGKARNAKRVSGLEVLVVDYIGLMTGMDPKANRNTQLGEISRGLKNLAKELGIAVLCLAQLNRKAEERADQMPQMSDLRDSGEIEQDADVILFIKRPIMNNPELGDEWKNYAKLSVAKNRQGRCGHLDLAYISEQTRFASWAGDAPTKAQPAKNYRGGGL
jgi:replicative DNA helicase